MKIVKEIGCSFDPMIKVVDDNNEEIIRYKYELFQDIKYGDWSGMFGGPDKPMTDEEVWNELDALYNTKQEGETDEFVTKKREAWTLLKTVIKK